MTLTIRDFRPSDAEAAAAAYQAGRPHLVVTPRVVSRQTAHSAPERHYRLLVAELDGRVVGTVRCGVHADSSTPGQGFANISVLPEAHGRGAGGALLTAAEEHLAARGVTQIHSWADDEPDSLHRALAAGLTEAYTSNDGTSAPMPAINDALGYRRCASEWKFVRPL